MAIDCGRRNSLKQKATMKCHHPFSRVFGDTQASNFLLASTCVASGQGQVPLPFGHIVSLNKMTTFHCPNIIKWLYDSLLEIPLIVLVTCIFLGVGKREVD